jgi:hypothetical protein
MSESNKRCRSAKFNSLERQSCIDWCTNQGVQYNKNYPQSWNTCYSDCCDKIWPENNVCAPNQSVAGCSTIALGNPGYQCSNGTSGMETLNSCHISPAKTLNSCTQAQIDYGCEEIALGNPGWSCVEKGSLNACKIPQICSTKQLEYGCKQIALGNPGWSCVDEKTMKSCNIKNDNYNHFGVL